MSEARAGKARASEARANEARASKSGKGKGKQGGRESQQFPYTVCKLDGIRNRTTPLSKYGL